MMRKGLNSNLKSTRSTNRKLQNFDRKAKQLQTKSEQLVKENNEMEQRIASLKLMMQKEREERERLGGYRWKSSKDPTEVKSTMPKGEKINSKQKGQLKFKVLSDKPLEKYTKTTKMKINDSSESSVCGQCEKVKAKLDCIECGESYCAPCYKQFHAKGAMRKHTWKTIDQERLSASKAKAQVEQESRWSSETAIGKNESSTSEQSISATNHSEQGGMLSMGAYDEEANAKSFQDALKEWRNEPVTTISATDDSQEGGMLLMGTYDEEASAKSFQDALKEWRDEPVPTAPTQKKDLWVNPTDEHVPKETRSCATEPDVASNPQELKSAPDLKINFNPTMSYADRLMLKKHRKDPSSKNGFAKPNKLKPSNKKSKSPDATKTAAASTARENKMDAPSQQSATQELRPADPPRCISIQMLPSDEEGNKSGSPDIESSSPIINEGIVESPRARSDRFTLSQMGRLKIVELSFSDPENDSKSPDGLRSPSASSGMSNVSARRTASGLQGQLAETPTPRQGLTPHPPSTPSSNYIARQKILLSKNKKTMREEASALTLNKLKKVENKKWKPSTNYVGLDSFFTAGVEKENKKNLEKNSVESKALKNPPNVSDCPVITVGFKGSWRPDSSWSNVSEPIYDDVSHSSGKENNNKKGPKLASQKPREKYRLAKPSNTSTDHSTLTNNATPRVSLTDFDFLSAMPPMSKGDDFNKIHRASTATLFALSPQPPDIWNDDSECELLKVSKSPKNNSVLNESDEDERALEALSNEIADSNKRLEGRTDDMQKRVEEWEEDSLSIEDNDEGSGLTSSGDTDTQYDGDDSSDNEFYDSKTQVQNLK